MAHGPARGELPANLYAISSGSAGSPTGEPPPASCARPARRPNEEVCRPSSLIRLGWPDRAYGPARPAPLARLSRHSEACCHAGPTRLARARWSAVSSPGGAVSRCYPLLSGPAVTPAGESPSGRAAPRSPGPAALNEEVCRPSSLIRLGWPGRAYGPARPAPLARLSRHREACCHAGPS